MRGSGVGLLLNYIPKHANSWLATAKLNLEHPKRTEGTELTWRETQGKANFFFGFRVFSLSSQNQAQILVRLGIIWPIVKRFMEQFNCFRVSSFARVQDSKVILGLHKPWII